MQNSVISVVNDIISYNKIETSSNVREENETDIRTDSLTPSNMKSDELHHNGMLIMALKSSCVICLEFST